MLISGKNTAVGTTLEDVISGGGTLTLPTTARIHSVASDSAEDDSDGTTQITTATAAGTIVGVLQVNTQTIVGTIGSSGAGNVSVTVTGALVSGTPLTVPVAVSNDDTAGTVANKIRIALNALPAITTNYTVGGATTAVILTTKVAAANDATLNIGYSNGTASGLTDDATSVNTTPGKAGTGNATVIVTSGIVTGSPLTVSVAVTVGDTAATWAAKVRTALGATAAITDKFTVSGSTTAIVLTAITAAANDATLNISLADGTSNGITTAATSAATRAGSAGTGAKTIQIIGLDATLTETTETVVMNGTSAVNTVNAYVAINSMRTLTTGSSGSNTGIITATAATDSTVTCQMAATENKSEQAFFAVPKNTIGKIKGFYVAATNATSTAITTIYIKIKNTLGIWAVEQTIVLNATTINYLDPGEGFLPEIPLNGDVKISAIASAGSSSVVANFDVEYL